MNSKSLLILATSIRLFTAARSLACDLCGCAMPDHPWEPRSGLYLGVSEQFTRYNKLQLDGHEIDNDARQFLDSSITQFLAGYNFAQSFGVQVNVPYIYRDFRRTAETRIQEGTVSGLGDVSLLAHWMPIYRNTTDFTFRARLIGGVKFPTGDSDRLKEEAEEGHTHGGHEEAAEKPAEPTHAEGEAEHHEEEPAEEATLPESGIHGHDLALGSGSIDGVIGVDFFVRWKRAFCAAEAQYAIRSKGDHDYRYANDFQWSGGPGVYVIERDDYTLSFQAVCSGETKGKDEFRGQKSEDTAVTAVFLGPKITGTWKDRISAGVELAVPVDIDNSSLQAVPNYRVRGAISIAF